MKDFYTMFRDILPVENGGFRKGASFPRREMRAMLRNHALLSGTLLRDGNGRTVIVRLGCLHDVRTGEVVWDTTAEQ